MLEAYVVNLKSAKDRKERMEQEIARLGQQGDIKFHFYDAIDFGSERFLQYKNHWDWDWLTKLYRGKKLSDGEKACFASHYSLWQKCVQDNRAILVLEDDVVFLDGFLNQIQKISTKENVNFVRLMSFFQKPSKPFDANLNLTYDNICGTQGYYLTPLGAKKLISKSKVWFCPVDNFLDKSYLHTLPNFISNPQIIREESRGSCIGGSGRNQKPSPFFIITRELCSSVEFLWRKIYEYTH